MVWSWFSGSVGKIGANIVLESWLFGFQPCSEQGQFTLIPNNGGTPSLKYAISFLLWYWILIGTHLCNTELHCELIVARWQHQNCLHHSQEVKIVGPRDCLGQGQPTQPLHFSSFFIGTCSMTVWSTHWQEPCEWVDHDLRFYWQNWSRHWSWKLVVRIPALFEIRSFALLVNLITLFIVDKDVMENISIDF